MPSEQGVQANFPLVAASNILEPLLVKTKEIFMQMRRCSLWSQCVFFVALLAAALLPASVAAQTRCDEGNGPLNPAPPAGLSAQEIITKSAAREATFKEAREHYTYTQQVTVQELEGHTIEGEFQEVMDILYDDKGKRVEHVTYAPAPSLKRISISPADVEDFRNHLPFVLTTQDLPEYSVLYAGQQKVDEVDTYVFDLAAKKIEKGKRYFQGRIWVDNRDFQIVKTCGKTVPDKRKKGSEDLSPAFVTYREQVDGDYWFPTYTLADDILHFAGGDVHIREVLKYTGYKRFGVRSRIIYEGKEQQNAPPAPKATPAPK
jgi:hypothetical protein